MNRICGIDSWQFVGENDGGSHVNESDVRYYSSSF